MFDLGQKVSLKSSQLLLVVFFRLEQSSLSKDTAMIALQRAKEKFSDNFGHYILELFNVLAKFPFIASNVVIDK